MTARPASRTYENKQLFRERNRRKHMRIPEGLYVAMKTRLTEDPVSVGIGTYSRIFKDSQRDSFTY